MPEDLYWLETDGAVLAGERHKARDWPSVGGAGIVLWNPDLEPVLTEAVRLGPVSGSTEAEFRAALIGLRRARERRVTRLRLWSDCQPVLQHMTAERILAKRWTAAVEPELRELIGSFDLVEFRWTRSSHAVERRAGVPTADALARVAVGLGVRGVRRRSRGGWG